MMSFLLNKSEYSTAYVQPPSHLNFKTLEHQSDPEGETTANYRPEVLIKQWIEDINSQHSIYGINHEILG